MPYRYIIDPKARCSDRLDQSAVLASSCLKRADMAIRIAVLADEHRTRDKLGYFIYDATRPLYQCFAQPIARIDGKWTKLHGPWTNRPIQEWRLHLAAKGYVPDRENGWISPS